MTNRVTKIVKNVEPVLTRFVHDTRVWERPTKGTWFYPLWLRLKVWRWWMTRGKPYFVDQVTYSTMTIEPERVFDALELSARNLEDIYYRRFKHAIVGRRTYEALVGELTSSFSFGMDARLGFGRDIVVRGITIHFIPWYDGDVLLLPEWFNERFATERELAAT